MLNRRHIRTKAFQAIYAWFQSDKPDLLIIQKNSVKSCDSILDLYGTVLYLFVEILQQARVQIEKNKTKRLPSEADLNPTLKFVNNRVLLLIEKNPNLKAHVDQKRLDWKNQGELVRTLYRTFIQTEAYEAYMENQEDSYELDRAIVLDLFDQVIVPYEPIYTITDDKNMYWYDDISYVNQLIMSTLTLVNETNKSAFLMPENAFKNEDDEAFLNDLIHKTISNQESYVPIIKKLAKNWDFDRIALNDRIFLMMSFTELLNMPSLPIKVTMNEYLDLAKRYSTEKSHVFVNGILDKAIEEFNAQGQIKKSGRGLL